MSDHANIRYHLEECIKAYDERNFLDAAINTYWCVQYCKYGEPLNL